MWGCRLPLLQQLSAASHNPPSPGSVRCHTPLQNFTQMKQQLDAALLPANDASWNAGARFWARYLRCGTLLHCPSS